MYTVNNLDQSPTDILQTTSHKRNRQLSFFFSKASPLSNYHPTVFKIEVENYTCGDEFVQAQKAKLVKDHLTYSKIKAASNSGEKKFLGREVKGFNQQTWAKFAPEVATTCQREQFSLFTESKYLVEVSPKDTLWGIGMSMLDHDLMNKKHLGEKICNANPSLRLEDISGLQANIRRKCSRLYSH